MKVEKIEQLIKEYYDHFENTEIICCPIKSCKDEGCGMASVATWLREKLSNL